MPRSTTLRRRAPRATALVAAVLAACLALTACGEDDPAGDTGSEPAGSDGAFPVSVVSGPESGGEEITVEEQPSSIVSLSPTTTEMLWAIGAEDQVVAVDDQSDYPEGVPTTELSGYEPNVEAILEYEPDLVVASGDSGDLVSGMETVSVPVLVLPSATTLEETYSQLERLGAATGHVAEAAQTVGDIRTGIEEALADAPDGEGLTYFHEIGPDLYTVTSETFIGEIYGMFGLTSIADEVEGGDLYPQLSEEFVVSADPDLILVADNECCGVTPEAVSERPGWDGMTAVRNGQVHLVSEDVTSRWGPRVVEFAELVADLLAEHEDAAASAPAS